MAIVQGEVILASNINDIKTLLDTVCIQSGVSTIVGWTAAVSGNIIYATNINLLITKYNELCSLYQSSIPSLATLPLVVAGNIIYASDFITMNNGLTSMSQTSLLSSINLDNMVQLIDENSQLSLNCTAVYADLSTQNVTQQTVWSLTSNPGNIATLDLVNYKLNVINVTTDTIIELRSEYTEFGTTKVATRTIVVSNTVNLLTSITIAGVNSINESTNTTYTCTATYDNGSTQVITPTWSITSGNTFATINSSGVLTANSVTQDESVTIQASYTENSITRTITKNITIVNTVNLLTSIIIAGINTINEDSTSTYTCTATYDNGSTQVITPTWSITSGNTFATINSSGMLTANSVTQDESVTIQASYTENSITRTITKNITIVNTVNLLTSIQITGNNTLDESTNTTYTCTATYDNGSTQVITPTWSITSGPAVIDNVGILTPLTVTQDESVTIQASYTENSITRTITKNITIVNTVNLLTSIEITGALTVNEVDVVPYTCTATYDNGSTQDITQSTSWSIAGSPSFASIDSGTLTTHGVLQDEVIQIYALYEGQTTFIDVTILNTINILQSIMISGSPTVNENSTAFYTCTATYDDSSTQGVIPIWNINPPSVYASIDSTGILTTTSIPNETIITLEASYTEGGVTVTSSGNITILNNDLALQSIMISGTQNIDVNNTSQYTCTATYDDNSTDTVVPIWTILEGSEYVIIDSNGILTPYGTIIGDRNIVIQASYTYESVTETATFNITIVTDHIDYSDVQFDHYSNAIIGLPTLASDNNIGTYTQNFSYISTNVELPIKLDYFRVHLLNSATLINFRDYGAVFQGSNNSTNGQDGTWDTLINLSELTPNSTYPCWSNFLPITNVNTYQWYRIFGTPNDNGTVLDEWELLTLKLPKAVESLTIEGPLYINDNGTSQFTAIAHFNDNTFNQVVPTWELLDGSTYCSINGAGLVTTIDVIDNHSVTIKATYTYGNDTVSDTHIVPIIDRTDVSLCSDVTSSTFNHYSNATIGSPTLASDNNTTTYTQSFSYIAIDLQQQYKVQYMRLHLLNQYATQNLEIPSAIFEGSNNSTNGQDGTWTPLFNLSGNLIPSGTYPCWSEFIETPIPSNYQWYRISGLSQAPNTLIDEWELLVDNNELIPMLTSIEITGNNTLDESTNTTYTCTATYDDSSTQIVTPEWLISIGNTFATINTSGVLTANSVTQDESVTIQASYTENSITRTITKNITIINVVNLDHIEINPIVNLPEGVMQAYSCLAYYTDSSYAYVTSDPNCIWSITNGSEYIEVVNGNVRAIVDVYEDVPFTLQAEYTEGGITRIAQLNAVLVNSSMISSGIFRLINIGTSELLLPPYYIEFNQSYRCAYIINYQQQIPEPMNLVNPRDVTNLATWTITSGSSYVSINSSTGELTITSPPPCASIDLSVSYTENTTTVTTNITIIIAGSGKAPTINDAICIDCGDCIPICPVEVFENQAGNVVPVNADECIACCKCVNICPVEAITLMPF